MDAIISRGINQIYIVGGDGTHRGANIIADECKRRKLKVSVAGVPKTIDNDIAIIDRSFGFRTAIEEACKTVQSALVEARSAENGIAVVKLMGRDSGFIATHTVLAGTDANLCLIPEVPFQFDGPDGILKHLRRTVAKNGHAVVVVAEGAGQDMLEGEKETDASGNVKKKVPLFYHLAHMMGYTCSIATHVA